MNFIKMLAFFVLSILVNTTFSQGPCEGQTTYSYNGVTYDLVEIGDQCWFSEPIKTLTYSNGLSISQIGGSDNAGWTSNTDGALSVTVDGDYLYNWYAVNRGLCPSGYDIPTDADFIQLETELGLRRAERNTFDYRGKGINFKSNWFEAGLDLNFAGLRVDNDGKLKENQNGMYMWTLDTIKDGNAIDRAIFDYMSYIARHDNLWQNRNNKGHGMLAMCVKNDAEEEALFESSTRTLFIEPGFFTIETGDFLSASLNVGDTVFVDAGLTRNPLAGTSYLNSRNEVLVVDERGALVYEDDFEGQIIREVGGQRQWCGCLQFYPDGSCSTSYVEGSAARSCADVCQRAGMSWSGNAGDWKNCGNTGDQSVFPTETTGFEGTVFTTPKGREYQVTRYTNRLYFDNLPNPLLYASQLEEIRAYVDPEKRIPYSFEKQYSPSKREDTVDRPKFDYVVWDDPLGTRHGFKISEVDGYLVEVPVEDIPNGLYPVTFSCMCFTCSPSNGGIITHNVMATVYSGAQNCTNACNNGSLTSGDVFYEAPAGFGSEPGTGLNCGIFVDPLVQEESALVDYYPSFGDTTLTYNEQYFNFNVLDTMYLDPERTQPVRLGTSFINQYEEILYADSDGVLRRADYFESSELREWYGEPVITCRSILCCKDGMRVEVEVKRRWAGCQACINLGLDCWTWECGLTGELGSDEFGDYLNVSDYLKNSGDEAMVNLFFKNLEIRIDTARSQVSRDISDLDNFDGIYFDLRYNESMFPNININSIVSSENDHFDWLVDLPIKINDLYYAFNEDQQLRISRTASGQIPDGTMLPTGPNIKMCICCCRVGNTPWFANTPMSGPSWKPCGSICSGGGCQWGDCTPIALSPGTIPIDNSGGTWDNGSLLSEVYISYGDSAWYYNEIGKSLSVFDTLYFDSLKTIPVSQGYHFVSESYGALYVGEGGVLLTKELYDDYIILGPGHVTCICCDCYNGEFGPDNNCAPVAVTGPSQPCPELCSSRGYNSPIAYYNCYEDSELSPVDSVAFRSYENRLRESTQIQFVGFDMDRDEPSSLDGKSIDLRIVDSEGNEITTGRTKENRGFDYMIDVWIRYNDDYYFLINPDFSLTISETGVDPTMEIGRDFGGPDHPVVLSICKCWTAPPACSWFLVNTVARRRTPTCEVLCAPDLYYDACGDN